ncbi:MAG: MFS transporter [Bdellovibrionota bacterium]
MKMDATQTRWRISTFWVLLVGYIGYSLCRANLSAAFPLLSREFHYTNSQLGLIAMYSELAYAAGKFINGPIGDKIGAKKIFLLGMLGAIVANLAFSQGSSLGYFIIVWCICRYFLSMGWGGVIKAAGAWYPPERNGTIMGIISINFQLGGAIAAIFSGYLVSRGATWDKLFIYPAIILSVIMVASSLLMKSSPADLKNTLNKKDRQKNSASSTIATEPTLEVLTRLFSKAIFRHVLVFSFLTTFLRSMFLLWTAKFLVDLGMKDSGAMIASSIFPLVGCVGTFLLGWYTDHYAPKGDRSRAIWSMLVLLAVCLFSIAFLVHLQLAAFHPSWIIILIGMSGFFLLGPYSMSAGCLTLDIAGAHSAATAAGLIDGVGYIGGSIAVWGAGVLADRLGWGEVFVALGFFALASAFSAVMMGADRLKKVV